MPVAQATRGRTAAVVTAAPLALGLLATLTLGGTSVPVGRGQTRPSTPLAFASGPVVGSEVPTGYLNVYFGNLHSHTSYSDGVETPADAYRYARDEADLDFLAITEHNHSKAGKIAKNHSLYSGAQANSLMSTASRFTEDGSFVALYGQEFSTISSGNHVNVIDAPRVIDVANGAFGQLVNVWLPANLDSSGHPPILLMNHPATSKSPKSRQYGRDKFGSDAEWVRRMGAAAFLIAMMNGPSHESDTYLPPSAPAEGHFLDYLNLGFRLAPTADQDNHRANWGSATTGRTAIVSEDLSKPSLLRAMRARHVYATQDDNLRLVCRVNGQLCGDTLATTPGVGAELQIELTVFDDDEPEADYQIDVFQGTVGAGRAIPVDTVETSGNTITPLVIEDVRYEGGPQYVFLKVHQLTEDLESGNCGGQCAWLAPVWMTSRESSAPLHSPSADASRYVASRRSSLYHVSSECADAERIKASNRVVGMSASEGRTPHDECPRRR